MSIGWRLLGILAITLDLLVIFLVAKRAARRFPLVLIFCAVQILITFSNFTLAALLANQRRLFLELYWTGDFVAHAVISLLIISLIWQAMEDKPGRTRSAQLLFAGVLCFALLSAYIFYDSHLNRWMTPVSRNLSFCEELLNLLLWTMLLQRRASDYQLLMVSAGIGVQVTGEVIGHTLRLYTHTEWVPNVLLSLCEILCLVIWIWAFRAARSAHPSGSGTNTAPRAIVTS